MENCFLLHSFGMSECLAVWRCLTLKHLQLVKNWRSTSLWRYPWKPVLMPNSYLEKMARKCLRCCLMVLLSRQRLKCVRNSHRYFWICYKTNWTVNLVKRVKILTAVKSKLIRMARTTMINKVRIILYGNLYLQHLRLLVIWRDSLK
jgi:hypothetical protein